MHPADEYAASGRRKKPDASPFPQTLNWTSGGRSRSDGRRDVITEKRQPLPALSAEGIRWDVLAVTLTLVMAVFLFVLILDVSALFAGNDRIGRLSAGIASLESSNSILQEELSWARSDLSADRKDGEPVLTVVLSPAP